MTTLHTTLTKFLCLSLLIVPSTLVEGNEGNPWEIAERSRSFSFYHGSAAGKTMAARTANTKTLAIRSASTKAAAANRAAARKAERKMIEIEAITMVDELQLEDSGLNVQVLEYALTGYHRLLKKGALANPDILTVCDFSQSSSMKRMYVIDMRNRQLLYRTYVAHGIGSGQEFADQFSNAPESHKSSLGFYVTRTTYFGCNGLSLRIDGVDRGFNNLAKERNIVIHGAPYVSERILHKYGVMGTTFGCPAVPEELTGQIISFLENGTCFFIYYPSKKYLSQSSVLNG